MADALHADLTGRGKANFIERWVSAPACGEERHISSAERLLRLLAAAVVVLPMKAGLSSQPLSFQMSIPHGQVLRADACTAVD